MQSTMGRQAYPSDPTDKQWELLESLIPLPSLEGRPPIHERREIVNATLYSCAVAVLGDCFTMSFLPGARSITTFAEGLATVSGIKS